MNRHFFLIIILCLGLLFVISNAVLAYSWSDVAGFYGSTANKMGLNTSLTDPTQIVATIINSLLLLVGAVFVIMVIYSGFSWMTSAGNDDKIKKAKQNLIYAVVGVIIISSAYSISLFIASSIEQAPPAESVESGDNGGSPADNTCVGKMGVCKSSAACQQDSGTNVGTTIDCEPNICCIPAGSTGGKGGDCYSCGQGRLNICDANECGKLGNCVFYSGRCFERGDCLKCGYGRTNGCDNAECLAISGCTFIPNKDPLLYWGDCLPN